MKVLHVTHFSQGGIATILNELLESQVKNKDLEVSVLVAEGHDKYLTDSARVQVFPGGRSFLGLCIFAWAILKTYLAERPDIVHLHSTFAGVLGRLVLPWWGCAIVYQPHGVAFDPERVTGLRHKIIWAVEYLFAFRTSAFIAISEYERELIDQITRPEKIHQIDNGISDVEIDISHARNGKVLFVGRLDQQKGLQLLIDLYREHNVEVQLDVAGSAVVGSSVPDAVEGIHYLGWVDSGDLPELYALYSAVVMPSRWEGFGLVAIESLRSGTPVICSDRGALPSIIENGVTGFVSDLDEFGANYLDASRTLVANQDVALYQRCRRHYVENYEATIMCSKVLELYRSLRVV